MVAYIRGLVVEKNGWISEESFHHGVAVYQSIPDATDMQAAAYDGLHAGEAELGSWPHTRASECIIPADHFDRCLLWKDPRSCHGCLGIQGIAGYQGCRASYLMWKPDDSNHYFGRTEVDSIPGVDNAGRRKKSKRQSGRCEKGEGASVPGSAHMVITATSVGYIVVGLPVALVVTSTKQLYIILNWSKAQVLIAAIVGILWVVLAWAGVSVIIL